MEFDPVLVHDWLHRTAVRLPEKTALVCGDERWTFQMLDTASDRLSVHWRESGMKRGDRVAIFLDNSIETVVCMYAALKAGGVFVVLDPALKPPKLKTILGEIGAHTLVTHARKARIVRDVFPLLEARPSLLWVGGSTDDTRAISDDSANWETTFASLPFEGYSAGVPGYPPCLDVDLACLIYTSGSTGKPKGIMSTHHNVISACRSIIQYLGNSEEDRVLCALPLSFDYGLYQVLMCIMFGGTVILEPGFVYPHAILEKVGKEKVTGFPIVPSILAMMLRLKDLVKYDFRSLRYATNTGAALPDQHIRQFRSLFPDVSFFSMFGLTECKRVSYLPPGDIDRLAQSVGKAMPNCEVVLVDDQGREVPSGDVGEMVVRGSNVMQGYWQDPHGSGEVFRPGAYPSDRRLHTGDYFYLTNDGNLVFKGRKDDMIKCRGERISPREIEAVLLQLDGVLEAAVKGVPDEIDGQAVAAFVVASPGKALKTEDVRKHCGRHLENGRVPRHVRFIDCIPRTANGKIDWKELHLDEQIEMAT